MKKANKKLAKRSGNIHGNDKLVEFLYELMRDHLPTGTVELIVRNCKSDKDTTIKYCNGFLAQYAQDIAKRLQ